MSDWPYFPEVSEKQDQDFMDKLIALRKAFNRPMIVTSSYRPPGHPDEIKKSQPGPHTFGRAVDIAISGSDAFHLIALAKEFSMRGIGLKQDGPHKKRFLHLDDMPNSSIRPRPTVWSYG